MGHLEVTRLLLEHTTPPDINLKTYMGDTALSLAAYHGHFAIIDLLLAEKELDVTATDRFGSRHCAKQPGMDMSRSSSVFTRTLGQKMAVT